MSKKFKLRKIAAWCVFTVAGFCILLLGALYFFQEKLLFHPEILAKDHIFTFNNNFDEVLIPVETDVKLHGLLFKAPQSNGLVFYLHGNGGSVNGWGNIAETYTASGYDLFMIDYRGYGKSDGYIESEEQMHHDIDKAYRFMLQHYEENKIIIAGYSIGTGFATHLAQGKKVKALLLQAPYYSMSALINEKAPAVPELVKRYKIHTCDFLQKVSAPVYILHGTADQLIPFSHAKKLMKHAKPKDVLISIEGGGHNIKDSETFRQELERILQH